MFRKILPLFLLILLVIGLTSAGNGAAFRAGWSQGYAAGRQVGVDDGPVPESAPGGPYRDGGRYYGPASGFFPFFWGAGLFFKLLLFLLLFGLIARLLFRPWRWSRWHHGHGYHHGREKPPWAWQDDEPGEEKVYKV